MNLGGRDTLLTLVTAAMLFAGILLIIFGDYILAVAGILLITLSAIIFIVDAKDLLVKTDEHTPE